MADGSESDTHVSKATPVGIIKRVLRTSQALGAKSFTYHVKPSIHSAETNIPRLLFSNAWPNRGSSKSLGMQKHIEKVHDIIITEGLPTNYLSLMAGERVINAKFAANIQKHMAAVGLQDEYMIPVYGPYKIEGCMCFGFSQDISTLSAETRCALEVLAAASHVKTVSCFHEKLQIIQLSSRETEVLQWLALGKSIIEISMILGIKPATIDTYTRRMYRKLGVHNKVGAVLAGVATSKINM